LLLLFEVRTNVFKKASERVDELLKAKKFLSLSDQENLYIDIFNLGLKTQNYDFCVDALSRMKENRSFSLNDNYKFMKSLFDFFYEGKVIYLGSEELRENNYLKCQAQTIKYLSSGLQNEALIYWESLRKNTPRVYSGDFVYTGKTSLFSVCLDKCLSKNIHSVFIPKMNSKKEKLIYFSEMYSGVVTKKDLYFAI
jgi:hypothetical protein